MSGHTSGPWRETDAGVEAQAFNGSWKWLVERVRGGTPEERKANARLIAAAPELLHACKMIADLAVCWEALTPGDIAEVRAAIAKAEGR
jgi:hypothetical protein